MKPAVICLWFTGVLSSEGLYVYQDAINDMYCDKDKYYFSANVDGDQVLYVDFKDSKVVSTLPYQLSVDWDKYYGLVYAYAVNEMNEFRSTMEYFAKELDYPPEAEEPPWSVMYTSDEARLGRENTLVCYITGFYPPLLTVRWTRNSKNLTTGVSSSTVHINNDGSFNMFSALKFTPQEGDIYTCTVEHQALEEPLTRYWDVEVSDPSLGPSVFCGVGLTLGLLGAITGTFFFVKGRDSLTSPQP